MRDLADRALTHRDGPPPGWVRIQHATATVTLPLDRHAPPGVDP